MNGAVFDFSKNRCPFCNFRSKQLIEGDDYGTHAMLWCDKCNGRGFLDLGQPVDYERKDTIPLLKIESTTGTLEDFFGFNPTKKEDIPKIFEKHKTAPVMSYNLKTPVMPYPANFPIEHDGRYVCVKFTNGTYGTMWGD